MVSSFVVICYTFQIEAGNYAVCVACAFFKSSPGFLIVGVESISILSLFLVFIGGFRVGF